MSKSYEFHDRNIGLVSGNNNRMEEYFMEMHIDLCMRKVIVTKISLSEFICMTLNSKLYQVVTYITDDQYSKRFYVIILKN